jgi:hypothetical protein
MHVVDEKTRFYIDYEWWESSGLSLESYLNTRLDESVSLENEGVAIDLIDPQTGEVRQLSSFEYAVQNYFRQLPGDFARRASLVDAVFCVLLANGNRPMAASEIADHVQRPADVIAKTLGGTTIYQGIRPHFDD